MESIFGTIDPPVVVFHNKISEKKEGPSKRNYPDYTEVKKMTGPWVVNFDPAWGGPATVTFPELTDWTEHADDGIKYYSGTAVYNNTFTLDFEPQKEKQYFLELGSVKDAGIAEVKINDISKGVVWTPPFRVEITRELKKGENTLEIKVVNSWYNRVAGDQIFPGVKQYTRTNIVLSHDFRGRPVDEIPLEPSGLMGPVIITEVKERSVK